MTVAPPPGSNFWNMVAIDDPAGCWMWKASKNREGYGQFTFLRSDGHKVTKRAHRLTYEMLVGPIPEGLTLDHLCRNRACVNPAHLEPVTNRENILRGEGFSGRNSRKTHCPRGHEYTEENTIRTGTWRRCRTCHYEKNRVRDRLRAQKRRAA